MLQKTQLMIEAPTHGITDSSIYLTWNAVSGNSSSATTYTVQWNEPSQTGFSSISLERTSNTVNNLQSNTLYSFSVVASSGETSNEITIATSKYNNAIRVIFRFDRSQQKSNNDQKFLTQIFPVGN